MCPSWTTVSIFSQEPLNRKDCKHRGRNQKSLDGTLSDSDKDNDFKTSVFSKLTKTVLFFYFAFSYFMNQGWWLFFGVNWIISYSHRLPTSSFCFSFLPLFIASYVHHIFIHCRGKKKSVELPFLKRLLSVEYHYNGKWYKACLTVAVSQKGQPLHNPQLKASQQAWHYKSQAILSISPSSLMMGPCLSAPHPPFHHILFILFTFAPESEWIMKAKVKDRGAVSLWNLRVILTMSNLLSSSFPLTGARQTLFRLNNGFSVISSNDMVRR